VTGIITGGFLTCKEVNKVDLSVQSSGDWRQERNGAFARDAPLVSQYATLQIPSGWSQDGHRMVRVMVSRERLAGVVQALAGATATPQ
jgi:hypothetical protein